VSIEWINQTSEPELVSIFRQCCSSETWVRKMVSGRPYSSREAVFRAADDNWRRLDEADYLQAFEGHPMIGDIQSLKTKDADTQLLSVAEQSGVDTASNKTLETLAVGNREYLDRFGFIFIVSATGKSSSEMLGLLQSRLENTREEEIRNAADEQRKITRSRLEKLL
jgi:2-oxo-4-hydroxy-4-carboxy-5-ureidoimidazoline decarboxylase